MNKPKHLVLQEEEGHASEGVLHACDWSDLQREDNFVMEQTELCRRSFDENMLTFDENMLK